MLCACAKVISRTAVLRAKHTSESPSEETLSVGTRYIARVALPLPPSLPPATSNSPQSSPCPAIMAYNSKFNPDRLPAHAEPEQVRVLLLRFLYMNQYLEKQRLTTTQAAAMLSGGRDSARPPRTSSARPEYNAPPPASSRPDDRYGRGHSNSYGSYDSRPPPGAYGAPDPRYDDRARYDSQPRPQPGRDPRYDVGSPPPQNYGHGPPPSGYHGRPPIQQRPPPTPAPPRDGNDREALMRLFQQVDRDGNRALTEAELKTALVNGDWSPFDPHTVRMMIRCVGLVPCISIGTGR